MLFQPTTGCVAHASASTATSSGTSGNIAETPLPPGASVIIAHDGQLRWRPMKCALLSKLYIKTLCSILDI